MEKLPLTIVGNATTTNVGFCRLHDRPPRARRLVGGFAVERSPSTRRWVAGFSEAPIPPPFRVAGCARKSVGSGAAHRGACPPGGTVDGVEAADKNFDLKSNAVGP